MAMLLANRLRVNLRLRKASLIFSAFLEKYVAIAIKSFPVSLPTKQQLLAICQ